MRIQEEGVKKISECFWHTPSAQAKKIFFYPLVVGHSYYKADYFLHRESYDSFLLMHICKGNCIVSSREEIFRVSAGQTVLLNCYSPHAYYSDREEWEALWLHFDGPVAHGYYEYIIQKCSLTITHENPIEFVSGLYRLYQQFCKGAAIREALASEQITQLLTSLTLTGETGRTGNLSQGIIEESIAYIREHLCEDSLSLETLSTQANLSRYYYARLFKRETGCTPHEYILQSRINMAKYLLKSTVISVKEICFRCGFHSESAFCHTFRKWERMTPGAYRRKSEIQKR